MTQENKTAAFLAYLLLVIGWLYVFISHRNDRLAMYHTKQSIMLVIVALLVPVVWAIFSFIVTFIPYVGALLAVSSFSLVIVVYLFLIGLWIIGMVFGLAS